MEFELTGIFRVKLVAKIYSFWVPLDLMPSCLCIVMFLSEETYKCSEPYCYALVFF